MDEAYDVIVLGTALKECILSGLLFVDGLKVLHMDRNDYYGGESSSLNLTQGDDKPREQLGSSREYNVDKVPKFMMANGGLVRILFHTNVTKHLNFKVVDDYKENDPKSHERLDLSKITAREVISKYGLEDDKIDFIGHALALHINDGYMDQPALDFVKRMKLYAKSLARFQGGSPYIYPLYGLGELPQAFARLSAVYGRTYMLNKPECKVEFDGDGKAIGVTSEGETTKCKKVVCDPSYFPDKMKKIGRVARAICIMSNPIPDTHDSHSVQGILPQKQLGRKSDICYEVEIFPMQMQSLNFIVFYLLSSYLYFVTSKTDTPEVKLKPGIDLLRPLDEIFCDTYDKYVPKNDSETDHCYISTSYDPTTHFENTVNDTLDLTVDLSAASAVAEE
ncbi:hypothetical protein SLE2022_120950 [Rubroshorea leprosula]